MSYLMIAKILVLTGTLLFLIDWTTKELVKVEHKNNLALMQENQQKYADLINEVDTMLHKVKSLNDSMTASYEKILITNGRLYNDRITTGSKLVLNMDTLVSKRTANITSRTYDRLSLYDFDITTPSGLTAKELDLFLQGSGLQGLGAAFIKAELRYGINAAFFVSLAIEESAWGRSGFSRERNNIFGWGAFSNNPNAALWFNSKEECIMTVAKHLREDYIDHRGLKIISSIHHRYASNPGWGQNIMRTMRALASY